MLRPLLLLLAFTNVFAAEKKPVAIDALMEKPGHRGGSAGTPIWAPDGKRFITIQEKKVMLYDVPAKSEKELLSLDPLETAAVAPPEPEAFDWQNRRVSEESVQWSGDGKQLLISAKGDLFLFHLDSRKWDQLTATAVEERDAKLSPDGKRVGFRREHDLYTLDMASKEVTQLTHDGTPTLWNGELDWVYPEELDLGTAWWWSPDWHRVYAVRPRGKQPVTWGSCFRSKSNSRRMNCVGFWHSLDTANYVGAARLNREYRRRSGPFAMRCGWSCSRQSRIFSIGENGPTHRHRAHVRVLREHDVQTAHPSSCLDCSWQVSLAPGYWIKYRHARVAIASGSFSDKSIVGR